MSTWYDKVHLRLDWRPDQCEKVFKENNGKAHNNGTKEVFREDS